MTSRHKKGFVRASHYILQISTGDKNACKMFSRFLRGDGVTYEVCKHKLTFRVRTRLRNKYI